MLSVPAVDDQKLDSPVPRQSNNGLFSGNEADTGLFSGNDADAAPVAQLEQQKQQEGEEEKVGFWAGLKGEWNQVRAHFKRQFYKELVLLKFYWIEILVLALATFFHSSFTKLAYYLYDYYGVSKQPVLVDLLYKAFGKLGDQYRPIVEVITFTFLGFMVLFGLSPLVVKKDYYAVHILFRYLLSTVVCFIGRIVAFMVTILPSPASHCRYGSPDYAPPKTGVQIVFGVNVFDGCADLIYSAHTVYCMTVALMYVKYGKHLALRLLLFCLVITNALLIIALENHYSVDVWLAIFVSPWVFTVLHVYVPDKKPQRLTDIEREEREANPKPIGKLNPKYMKQDLESFMNHLQEISQLPQKDGKPISNDDVQVQMSEDNAELAA